MSLLFVASGPLPQRDQIKGTCNFPDRPLGFRVQGLGFRSSKYKSNPYDKPLNLNKPEALDPKNLAIRMP